MTTSLPARFSALLDEVAAELVERDEVVRVAGLSMLAGTDIYLLGPPGVAKTQLLTALTGRIRGAVLAVADLHGMGTKDDLLGPVDIPALLHERRWARLTAGLLPDAHLVLLDELDVAPPHLTDLLLRLLSERRWHDGGTEHELPLVSAFAAGNGIPAGDRLWDRFTARMVVDDLDAGGMLELLDRLEVPTGGGERYGRRLTLAQWRAARRQVERVAVPPPVRQLAVTARAEMTGRGVAISARRLVQGLRLVRASAWLAGRPEAEPADLQVLRHVLWCRPEQAGWAEMAVAGAVGVVDDPLARVRTRLAAVQARVEGCHDWGSAALELLGLEVEEDLAGIGRDLLDLSGHGVDVAEAEDHLRGLRALLAFGAHVGAR